MQPNAGGPDRLVRFVVGTALLAVSVAGYVGFVRLSVGPLPQALSVALVALALLVTGVSRRCPLNYVVGPGTSERD
jgi:hypothetical protein